jgi:hypothetical protein
MKNLLCLTVIGLSLVGCASEHGAVNAPVTVQSDNEYLKDTKVYKLQGYKGPEAMDNSEVLMASKQCIYNKMRPNVSYLSVRTDQGKVLVPVSVICEPI